MLDRVGLRSGVNIPPETKRTEIGPELLKRGIQLKSFLLHSNVLNTISPDISFWSNGASSACEPYSRGYYRRVSVRA